jgi:hypothetical protein
MIRDSSFDRWRRAERLVLLSKVVVHHVERTAAEWFSIFLEKALVSRVKRRMDMRIVRFWRSM